MSPPLLAQLGLGRLDRWDRPTLLDRLLTSPIGAAAYYLYGWIVAVRGWAAVRQRQAAREQPDAPPPVRVVCLSDTHDRIVPDVPAGDLLIHAGDLTDHGRPADLQRQLDWLASLPHAHKVVVCGNHDSWFDPAARVAKGIAGDDDGDDDGDENTPRFAGSVHYLQHDARVLTFANGRRLKVYGAPDIPRCGPSSFAFQYDRSNPPWKDTVPDDTDILITHPPPRHHLDLELGCAGLLDEVWRVRPPLHVFGHVHWGAGRQIVFWDETQRAYEALAESEGEAEADAEADAGRAPQNDARCATLAGRLACLAQLAAAAAVATALLPVWLFAPDVLASDARGASTILINAGQMYGNTGRLGNSVQVIDL